MIIYYAAALIGALVISLALTPYIGRIALRIGFVDKPDGHRKVHLKAIALGGGFAVWFAVVMTSIAVIGVAIAFEVVSFNENMLFVFGLLLASTLLVVVGVMDDAIGIRGRYKLAGQIAACLVLIACGLHVECLSIFHLKIELGLFAIPFVIMWLIGTINSINLLDGVDGLASTIGLILSLTVAILTWENNHLANSLIAVALAGALLGFLRYNIAPASIYLGDTGSMLIGLVLGAITLNSSIKGSSSIAFFVPMCILAIPIFDSVAALLRRKLTGRSLFATDRGHIHHMLLHRGWTASQTTLFIGGVCLVTCIGAILSGIYRKDVVAIITMVIVFSSLIAGKFFGHVEFSLIIHRSTSILRALVGKTRLHSSGVHERIYHLNGSSKWDPLWAALVESAETFGLMHLELTICIPSCNDLFHASWAKPGGTAPEKLWNVKVPFLVDGFKVGKLVVSGHSNQSVILQINQFADFLEPIEDQIKYYVNCATNGENYSGKFLLKDQASETLKAGKKFVPDHSKPSAPLFKQIQQINVN